MPSASRLCGSEKSACHPLGRIAKPVTAKAALYAHLQRSAVGTKEDDISCSVPFAGFGFRRPVATQKATDKSGLGQQEILDHRVIRQGCFKDIKTANIGC